jgi:hypothetical protein
LHITDRDKGKVHPRTDHEVPQGKNSNISNLSLTSALKGRGVVKAMPQPLYPWKKDLVPTVQEAGWAPGQIWLGAENLALTMVRSSDCPACSESLYRLCFSGPCTLKIHKAYMKVFNMTCKMKRNTVTYKTLREAMGVCGFVVHCNIRWKANPCDTHEGFPFQHLQKHKMCNMFI